MPRNCGCNSASCSCLVEAGDGIDVTGAGSVSNPYVVSLSDDFSLAGRFQVQDTNTVDLTLSGDGSLNSPYILTADATLALGDLTDVDDSDQSVGYVLGRQADGTFAMQTPSTAAPGTIITDDSLDGDGSIGDPLSVHSFGPENAEVFTASGTWTKPDGLKAIRVRVVGGGGAGGGCFSTGPDEVSEGGGGGGGGYSESIIPAAALAANETVTVGEGGSGLLLDPSEGGTSSFGTFLQATGGEGGALGQTTSSGAVRRSGGDGGVGSGGDINVDGGEGGVGLIVNDTNVCKTGSGGGTPLAGRAQSDALNSTGRSGRLYGGGSSGASSGFNQSTRAALNGADGVVIVEHFYLP